MVILLRDIWLLYLLAWSVSGCGSLIWKTWTDICLETSFDENSCCIEISELICGANRLSGFCVVLFFSEICFRIDIKELHLYFYYSRQESYWGSIQNPVEQCDGTFYKIFIKTIKCLNRSSNSKPILPASDIPSHESCWMRLVIV